MGPRPQGRGRAPGSRLRPALQRTVQVERAARPPAASPALSAADAGLRSLFEEAARVPRPSARQQADLLRRASSGDQVAEMVADARRIHDEELLRYLDPDAAEVDEEEDEHA